MKSNSKETIILKPTLKTAVIALGSNLGDSIGLIKQALVKINEHPHIQLLKSSSFYKTKPIGYTEQPDFINAVCLIETSLTPFALLKLLLAIEKDLGRERSFKNAPRTLDLDLIDYNQQTINSETLTLPHPRATIRSFVLIPLLELAPDYQLADKTITELLQNLDANGVQLLVI